MGAKGGPFGHKQLKIEMDWNIVASSSLDDFMIIKWVEVESPIKDWIVLNYILIRDKDWIVLNYILICEDWGQNKG